MLYFPQLRSLMVLRGSEDGLCVAIEALKLPQIGDAADKPNLPSLVAGKVTRNRPAHDQLGWTFGLQPFLFSAARFGTLTMCVRRGGSPSMRQSSPSAANALPRFTGALDVGARRMRSHS